MTAPSRFMAVDASSSPDMLRWETTIEGWVPDRRLLLNARNRTHWQVIRKIRDLAKETVANHVQAIGLANRVGKLSRAYVTILFEFPQRRRRDPDNLAGMVKPILDAIVQQGLLVDDDCDHIELTISARATGRYATTLTVTGYLASEIEQLPF